MIFVDCYCNCWTWIKIIFFTLNDDHFTLRWNHPCAEGSLHSQKDVVACDDFCADVAVSQNGYQLFSIAFDLVYKGNYPQHCYSVEPFSSFCRH